METNYHAARNTLEAANTASGIVRTLFVAFMALSGYVIVAIASTDDLQLLRYTPLTLPILNTDINLKGFYIWVPWLYFILHANLLLLVAFLTDKLFHFESNLTSLTYPERTQLRKELHVLVFTQYISSRHTGALGYVVGAMVWITLAVMPIVLLLFLQLDFLPAQEETIVLNHNAVLSLDVLVVLYFWLKILGKQRRALWPDGWRPPLWRRISPSGWVLWVVAFFSLYISWFVAIPILGERELSLYNCQQTAVLGDESPRPTTQKQQRNADRNASLSNALQRYPQCKGPFSTWLFKQPAIFKKKRSDSTLGDYYYPPEYLPKKLLHTIILYLANSAQQLVETIKNIFVSQPKTTPRTAVSAFTWENIDQSILSLFQKILTPLQWLLQWLGLEDMEEGGWFYRHLFLPDQTLTENTLSAQVYNTLEDTDATSHADKLDAVIGLPLRGRNLRFADFESNKIPKIKFSISSEGTPTELTGANLRKIQASQAAMKGASLAYANLSDAQLQGADLTDAQLQGADLRSAQLQGADLRSAQLQGAALRFAQLQGADLREAQLQGADLSWTELQGAALRFAQLQGADLREAQLQGADLSWTELQGADLREAQLQGAVLTDAQLQGADLRSAKLQGADLSWTELQGADLREAQLQGAVLTDAQLQGADLRSAKLQGAYLIEAQLQGADLRKAQLQGALLDNIKDQKLNLKQLDALFTTVKESGLTKEKYQKFVVQMQENNGVSPDWKSVAPSPELWCANRDFGKESAQRMACLELEAFLQARLARMQSYCTETAGQQLFEREFKNSGFKLEFENYGGLASILQKNTDIPLLLEYLNQLFTLTRPRTARPCPAATAIGKKFLITQSEQVLTYGAYLLAEEKGDGQILSPQTIAQIQEQRDRLKAFIQRIDLPQGVP